MGLVSKLIKNKKNDMHIYSHAYYERLNYNCEEGERTGERP